MPNILIDTGSTSAQRICPTSSAADIYLGDVSSQVYEFLLEPRPCVFLNGHNVDWKDNPFYFHWTLGQVVEDVDAQLGKALARADEMQSVYEPKQRAAFAYTFRMEKDSTAAQRGADAIAEFMLGEQASAPVHATG